MIQKYHLCPDDICHEGHLRWKDRLDGSRQSPCKTSSLSLECEKLEFKPAVHNKYLIYSITGGSRISTCVGFVLHELGLFSNLLILIHSCLKISLTGVA